MWEYRICVGSSSDREGELAHESTRKTRGPPPESRGYGDRIYGQTEQTCLTNRPIQLLTAALPLLASV